MKVVIVSPAHPLRGGIAASSERLAQALQQAGDEVVMYSFSLQYPSFLFPGKSQFTDDPAPQGLHIKTKINSINPFNWLWVGWQLARIEKPQRIVCRFWLPFMGPCLGTVLRVAKWLSPTSCNVTALVDNVIPHEKRFGDRAFAAYFVGACDDFVVMAHSVGKEIQAFLPKKEKKIAEPSMVSDKRVRFAPHPIYDTYGTPIEKKTARQQLGLPENGPLVLFFGFIRAYKGLDLLLEALADARLQSHTIHAVVAGECYEDWGPYQQIIDKHGLAERIHIHTDFIPADQVRVYFSAADLVVQPYKSATQSGISQIAYHFEKPMIVTNVGGLAEIVTDGVSGYVAEPNPVAIATAMLDFFENKREKILVEGLKQEKKRFSWENLVSVIMG